MQSQKTVFGKAGRTVNATTARSAQKQRPASGIAQTYATRSPDQEHLPNNAIEDTALPRVNEHALWSYFKACVMAFSTAILLQSLFVENNAPGFFGSRLFVSFASGIAMASFAPLMLIPIRILADIFRLMQVPRGYSDVLIGGLCGSIMMLPDLTSGDMPEPITICFTLGGLAGGFVYWRARGYPGLDRRYAKSAERINSGINRTRQLLS